MLWGMPDERTAGDMEALAERVRQARLTAALSVDAAAVAAGMSPVTWARVEKAQPVRALSYAGVEKVLGWAPGSVAAILAGGEPASLTEPTASPAPGNADAKLALITEIIDYKIPDFAKVDTIRRLLRGDFQPPDDAASGDHER